VEVPIRTRTFATVLLVAAAVALLPPAAWGAIAVGPGGLSGTRTTNGGGIEIVGAGGWSGGVGNNGFQISWDITGPDAGWWTYSYTISGVGDNVPLTKALSHFILEVTNPVGGIDDPLEWDWDSPFAPSEEHTTYDPNSSNPGLPGPIYGVKWDTPPDDDDDDDDDWTIFAVTFRSVREPVWGDFYAKDGKDRKDGGDETYAYNSGFGVDPAPGATDYTAWIARPNGSDSVPEPSSLVVWGFGFLACLAAAGFKRRRPLT
jgi:hypothetical protein